jgi:hypothetical protein
MQRGRWLWLVAAVAIVIPFSTQVPGCLMSIAAKSGTVVDAATGRGLANVLVFESARFDEAGLVHGSRSEALYHVIVATDADGNYTLPSQLSKVQVGIPGTGPTMRFVITAFKPGYIVAGDESGWKTDQRGEAAYDPPSVQVSPNASLSGLFARVDPIRMEPRELSLAEAAIYYEKILGVGVGRYDADDSAARRTRELGYNALVPLVCAKAEEIPLPVALAILKFAAAPRDAMSNFFAETKTPLDTTQKITPSVSARSVCDAMKGKGAQP